MAIFTTQKGGSDKDWLKSDNRVATSIGDNIYTNGRVGINNPNPTNDLTVSKSGSTFIEVFDTGNATQNVLIGSVDNGSKSFPGIWANTVAPTVSNYSFLYDQNTLETRFNARTGGGISFGINNVRNMVIDSVGNVGIGSTTPLQKLDINGAIRVGTTAVNAVGTIRYDSITSTYEGFTGIGNWDPLNRSPWTIVGTVVFQGVNPDGTPATNPVIDTGAFVNKRSWRYLGQDYVEEWIQISCQQVPVGASAGTGRYVIDPVFNISNFEHIFYSGLIGGVTPTSQEKTFSATLGTGLVSTSTGDNQAVTYALPYATNKICFITSPGTTGNNFVGAPHFAVTGGAYQFDIKFRYKRV